MIKTEFTFKLVMPISTHEKGDEIEIKELRLVAPSYKNRKFSVRLQQSFMRGINSLAKNNPAQSQDQQSNEPLKGDQIIGALMMSDVDLNEVFEDFEKLIVNGCGFIKDKQQMTEHHFNQLADNDLQLLLGEYIANFMIPSWMNQAMKT